MGLASSIKQRLEAGRQSLSEGGDSRVAMASVMLLLFAAGTFLNLASIPLSSGLGRDEKVGELILSDLAALACIVIGVRWRRLSPPAFQLLLVLGTLLISVGAYLASDGPYDAEMLYIWVALYAAYFFSRWKAVLQLAFVGLCYAAVLSFGHAPARGRPGG